eukprot:15453008-Alexandrium_andersonii.AAC.1
MDLPAFPPGQAEGGGMGGALGRPARRSRCALLGSARPQSLAPRMAPRSFASSKPELHGFVPAHL